MTCGENLSTLRNDPMISILITQSLDDHLHLVNYTIAVQCQSTPQYEKMTEEIKRTQICRIPQRIRPVPPTQHMSKDPHSISRILRILQLISQETQHTRWVVRSHVDVVEPVCAVPLFTR